jgi:putative transposase
MQPPSHRKRCRRINEAGHAHALTFSCYRRQPFLTKDRSCQWLVDSIVSAREKHRLHVWAFVFMPEHVHLLIWPTEENYSISRILESIKLPVTRRAVAYVRRNAPTFLERMLDLQPNGKQAYRFWQRGGGYDRNIIEPRTVWGEIEYMHANPTRRGLCLRPEDWLYSSAADYLGIRASLIPLDKDSLPRTEAG